MTEQEVTILSHLSKGDWLAIISLLITLTGALAGIAFAAWAKELKQAREAMNKLVLHFERMDRKLLAVELWAGQKDPEFYKLREQVLLEK